MCPKEPFYYQLSKPNNFHNTINSYSKCSFQAAKIILQSVTENLRLIRQDVCEWTPRCSVTMVIGAYLVGLNLPFFHALNCCGQTCTQTQPKVFHLQLESCTPQAAMGTEATVSPRHLQEHSQQITCTAYVHWVRCIG